MKYSFNFTEKTQRITSRELLITKASRSKTSPRTIIGNNNKSGTNNTKT